MSDRGKPLDFTLGDHDALLECAAGILEIINQIKAMDVRVSAIEARVKNVEDWKIRVMAIVGAIGIAVGFIFGKLVPLAFIVKPVISPHLP